MNQWDIVILGHDYEGWMCDFGGFKSFPPEWLWNAIPRDQRFDYEAHAWNCYKVVHPND